MSEITAFYSCVGWEGVGELEVAHIHNTESDFRLYIIKTGRTDEDIWEFLLGYFCPDPTFRTALKEPRPVLSIDFHTPRTKSGCRETLPPRALNMAMLIVEKALKTYYYTIKIKQRKD